MVASHFSRSKRREHIDCDGILGFGKHAGQHITEVPESWLRWALGESWISPTLRNAIEQRLDLDQPETSEEPDPTSAAVAFPLIIWCIEQHIWNRFGANDEYLEIGVEILDLLKQHCSKYTRKPWVKVDAAGKVGAA